VYTAAKPESVAIMSVARTPKKRWWLLSIAKAREASAAALAEPPAPAAAAAGLRCEI
jgi:hypothetical protein